MSVLRPKLTRRRGACEECRQKKVRCDGTNPCNNCKRNGSLCEYSINHSRRRTQGKIIQSLDKHFPTTTQPYVTNDSTMSDLSNPDRSSEAVISQDAEGSVNPLNTPLSEVCISQLVSDSAYSYPDFDFSDETIPSTIPAQIIGTHQDPFTPNLRFSGPSQKTSSSQDQISYYTPRNDTPMLDWLKLGHDQHLHQHSTAQFCGFLETGQDKGADECTLALFSKQIVADKAETKPLLTHRVYRIVALLQNAEEGSRRQQTVLDKVKVLLSPEHQNCLSDLLRMVGSGGGHRSLNLNDLPVKKLVQRAFREPEGPNLFFQEQDVVRIQERFLDPGRLPIEVSDMSLLIVSLAWGSLLEPEVSAVSRTALLDAVLEVSTLLLRQNASVRQFLALVAVLCLAEKTGSNNLPALILGSVSTAASLSLHLEPVLRGFCVSDEQVVQTKRALWMLYCIDKSYALRWQIFSLVSDGSLPTTNPPNNTLQSDVATTPSEWLWIRSQYSKICSNILQLQVSAEKELSEVLSHKTMALLTALEEWYGSTGISQMMLSLNPSDAMRVKLQISYRYYEARFHLLSIDLLGSRSPSTTESQKRRELLKQSIRDMIACSSTIPSECLLQDCNHLFINTLALCLHALDIVLDSDQVSGNKSRALLSIFAGFFARVDMMLPQSSVFEEVTNMIEILTYRKI